MKALLLLALHALAFADNAPEVNAVRDRARAFQEEAELQLGRVRRFNTAAHELGWRAQELAAAVEVTKTLPAARSRLQELAREQVYVEGIWDSLEKHEERIRGALAQAGAAARELPGLTATWQPESARIAGSLARLRATITERRAQAARDREAWLGEQREATMREIAGGRLRAVDDLKFAEKVRNAHHAFASVRRAFLKAGMEGRREEAENLLTGFRWLKGVLPMYLPLSSQKRVDSFRLLEGALGEVESKMAAEIGRWPREERRYLPFASLRIALRYAEVPPNKPAPNYREKTVKGEGGRDMVTFDRGDGENRPSIEFYRVEVPPPSEGFRKPGGPRQEGLVRPKIKEAKPSRPAGEVKDNVRRQLADKLPKPVREPEKPKPDAPSPDLRQETRELRELARRAEQDSDEPALQAEVREIAAEIARYEALQDFYGAEIDKDSAELRGLMAKSASFPGAVSVMPEAPAPVRDSGREADALAGELGKAIADSALGLIPGYDLANFAFAMATGHTFLGDQVNGDDKLTMGIFAVMSVIPAGTVVSNSLRQLKNLRKVDKAVARLLEKALQELPGELAHLRPVLAKAGTSGEFAVIGRVLGGSSSTKKGVVELADHLRSRGLTVHVYEPDKAYQKLLDKAVEENGGNFLKLPELRRQKAFQHNEAWALDQKRAGHGVLDMGDPYGMGDSLFLDHAEREVFEILKGIHVHK